MTTIEIAAMHSIQRMEWDVQDVKKQLQRVIELLDKISYNTSSGEDSHD